MTGGVWLSDTTGIVSYPADYAGAPLPSPTGRNDVQSETFYFSDATQVANFARDTSWMREVRRPQLVPALHAAVQQQKKLELLQCSTLIGSTLKPDFSFCLCCV